MAGASHAGGEALFALSLALAGAQAQLRRQEAEQARRAEAAVAQALAGPDTIDLPELGVPPPQALDRELLAPVPALYLAFELDAAGLLRTGELVAGLFAAGTINAPLDAAVGRALHDFWRARQQRLNEQERAHLFAQVFEAGFERRLRRLCEALVALADNAGIEDLRENVGLETAAAALADGLWPALSGMAAFAARDVVDAIEAALRFLRERSLQLAFGARDLWSLVAMTNGAQGGDAGVARDHVERGRQGMVVLRWWADHAAHGARLDLADAQAGSVIGAAERWLLASRGAAVGP